MAKSEAIDGVLSTWARPQAATAAAVALTRAGVPAAALARSSDLVSCKHLHKRQFWDAYAPGVLPRLPWRASFGRISGTAPGLGADTEVVLREVLGLSPAAIDKIRGSGAFG